MLRDCSFMDDSAFLQNPFYSFYHYCHPFTNIFLSLSVSSRIPCGNTTQRTQ